MTQFFLFVAGALSLAPIGRSRRATMPPGIGERVLCTEAGLWCDRCLGPHSGCIHAGIAGHNGGLPTEVTVRGILTEVVGGEDPVISVEIPGNATTKPFLYSTRVKHLAKLPVCPFSVGDRVLCTEQGLWCKHGCLPSACCTGTDPRFHTGGLPVEVVVRRVSMKNTDPDGSAVTVEVPGNPSNSTGPFMHASVLKFCRNLDPLDEPVPPSPARSKLDEPSMLKFYELAFMHASTEVSIVEEHYGLAPHFIGLRGGCVTLEHTHGWLLSRPYAAAHRTLVVEWLKSFSGLDAMFAHMDSNGDGRVSREEIEAAVAPCAAKWRRLPEALMEMLGKRAVRSWRKPSTRSPPCRLRQIYTLGILQGGVSILA